MLESMTGYGRGEHTTKHYRATAEIRSVNFRYCEISLKMPSQLCAFEQPLKEKVQKSVKRGKISLNVELEHHTSEESSVHIREDLLMRRISTLERIRGAAGIQEPIRLEHLLVFEELFNATEEDPELLKEQEAAVEQAVMEAVEQMLEMRRREGRMLQKDLEERLGLLAGYCAEVRNGEKERIQEARVRMTERLQLLLEDKSVDENRIEQEIAILADRLDISEELVRMDAHISYFIECLKENELQGKKLNFILQEMHREVNTIGSKANNSAISRTVVGMKEIVENIREQIQNIA